MDKKALRKELDALDAVAVSTETVDSVEEIMLAKHLAEKSAKLKTNIARNERYEFLLWLSGKRDISRAIRATAPKEGEEFILIVFSNPEETLERLKASKHPLRLKDDGEPIRLERISLSRL